MNVAARIRQLLADYDTLHDEAMRRIVAAKTGRPFLDDLQHRENSIDRELRSLGSSLSRR